jgi:hypothetical protein
VAPRKARTREVLQLSTHDDTDTQRIVTTHFYTIVDNLSFSVNTGLSDKSEDEEIFSDEFNLSGIVPLDSDSE